MTAGSRALSRPHPDQLSVWRFLAAAAVALCGTLGVAALVALLGGWITGAVAWLNPAEWLAEAMPGLAAALDGFSFVSSIGREAGWASPLAVIAFLVIRGLPRPAVFVVVAAVGGVLLGTAEPLLAALWRAGAGTGPGNGTGPGDGDPAPYFDDVLGLTVNLGVVLLVVLPVASDRARRWLLGGATVLVVGFAALAVGSGDGTVPAVTAGWATGTGWLLLVALAYRRWGVGIRRGAPLQRGIPVDDPARLEPAPARDRVLRHGARGALTLAGAAVLIAAVLLAVGRLVILRSEGIQRFDEAVIDWFVAVRTPSFSAVMTVVDALGNTPGIIAVQLAAAPIALAITRRRAPAVFLLTVLIGETSLYLGVAALVNRERPAVDHAGMLVPHTSGFPSGHVAATLVTYGGIALLILTWSRSRWRRVPMILAVLLVAGVTVARLYWGMHYPSDLVASLAYGTAWLAVCWWVFRPDRGSGRFREFGGRAAAEPMRLEVDGSGRRAVQGTGGQG